MRPFLPVRGGYEARIDTAERAVLAQCVREVGLLLGHDVARPLPEPAAPWPAGDAVGPQEVTGAGAVVDPAVARLLPDAYRDDPARAAEFRRLTEEDVRRAKLARLRALWLALHTARGRVVRLEPEVAREVGPAMTDVRLVVAERLGIETEEDLDAVRMSAEGGYGPHAALASVHYALELLQESLMVALLEAEPDPAD